MKREEYIKRMEAIQTSAAAADIRKKALEKLDSEFYGIDKRNKEILKSIKAGEADISDIGGMN